MASSSLRVGSLSIACMILFAALVSAQEKPSPQEIKKAFDALDQDKNGSVSKDEFTVIFYASDANKDKKLDSSEFPPEQIKLLDKNADGALSVDEFTPIFDAIDQNKDGSLSLTEFSGPPSSGR